jgi:glycosyltransferase involved in cell wall biosynthesis
LFAFSYAALDILRWAKARGWLTVLGQIDPGPAEERIVSRFTGERTDLAGSWSPAPALYWRDWQAECQLADIILVNSGWSRNALTQEGVPENKIKTVPLALEPSAETTDFVRTFPDTFSSRRPMRILFLGQISLRKGIAPIFDAMRLLAGEALEFWFVGPEDIAVPADLRKHQRVKWYGPVPRSATAKFYRDADVFLFPTFSDGFGLTQLEAQSWKLPIIASRFCGEVVENGRNGLVLDVVNRETIVSALLSLLRRPTDLVRMSRASGVLPPFTLDSLGRSLAGLFSGPT